MSTTKPSRHLPVRPDLVQLRHQAKDLLRAIHRGDPAAVTELHDHHPGPVPQRAHLADAQLALARSYGVASWPRLVVACRLIDAIWRDDSVTLRAIVVRQPSLLHEDARAVAGSWGPPLSYAANLGRDRLIELLHQLGATDLHRALERAALQGRIDTARRLQRLGARPGAGSVMGPAETQNGSGLALLLELGAPLTDAAGDRMAPVALVLETYSRDPRGKHVCLELFAAHGIALPDTPAMAVHRGRIDLLERHLRRDPAMLHRTYPHQAIYPPELGCSGDHALALHGAPLDGATLLHLCVDNDELELARWLLDHGAGVNARAAVDGDGFGGHTALFGCVVSQPFRVGLRTDAGFAALLLERGADPRLRASLRKQLRFTGDDSVHAYPDVTAAEWGTRFHDRRWVNPAVLRLLTAR